MMLLTTITIFIRYHYNIPIHYFTLNGYKCVSSYIHSVLSESHYVGTYNLF